MSMPSSEIAASTAEVTRTSFDIPVVPYVQIVPAGYDKDKGILRAVAVQTPDPKGMEGRASSFDLRLWPETVIKAFKTGLAGSEWTFPIRICIAPEPKARPDPVQSIDVPGTAVRLRDASKKRDFVDKAQAVWLDSLAPEYPEDLKEDEMHWQDLGRLIASALSANRTTPGRIADKNPDGGVRRKRTSLRLTADAGS